MKAPETAVAYDVAVVGAGPAGIAAADALIAGGARVALFDRHARPGGKACGGGLTGAAFARAGVAPNSPPAYGRRFDALEVRSPLGRFRAQNGGPLIVVIDRIAWQAERLEALAERGCALHLDERVVGFPQGAIATERAGYRCGHVIGADGASSRVRRHLGLDPGPGIRAVQTIAAPEAAPGVPPDVPIVWFCARGMGLGYAWSFPAADGTLRLGMGADAATTSAARLRRAFGDWLRERGAPCGRMRAATIRCGYAGHRFGRYRLAGDAAGLASPLTGEGIAQALESGAEVAREILEPSYRSEPMSRLAARHRRTRDVVATPHLGAVLFALAPHLLRSSAVREAAFRRYA
jgi:flavin-dependent dehydrogenase